jgi:hypothetical protein
MNRPTVHATSFNLALSLIDQLFLKHGVEPTITDRATCAVILTDQIKDRCDEWLTAAAAALPTGAKR